MRLRELLIDLEPLRTARDFRRIFLARVVSLLGLGMAAVALSAQVYDLTGSSFGVAASSMIMSVAVLAGSLAGGVLADRTDRRTLIVAARALAGLAFLALAGNAFSDHPSITAIYACVAWDGLATGVSVTTLMAVTPTLVRPDQLRAAGALVSLTGDIGAIAAPFLGGVLIALSGPGWAFLVAAVATGITTVLVARVRPLPPGGEDDDEDDEDSAGRSSPLAGFRFALRHRTVGALLALGLVTSLFAVPTVLFPEVVDKRLGGGDLTLGLLYTAPAAGAVLASATSGWIGRVRAPGAVLLAAVFAGGLGTVAFGLSGHVLAALAALAVVGAAGVVYEVLEYALVQHHTPDGLRGRITSVVTAEETTGDIVGDIEAAALARWFNPSGAAVVNGVVCAAAAVLAAVFVPGLRRAELPADDEDDADDENTGPGDAPGGDFAGGPAPAAPLSHP
ncbi:enterobactin transporter EntS [Actinomadura syzygii]|uniref:Multidrug efflux pump Tap n=1 Tax=Actinomadura syzygii TaxID=1427538 RepID=A0A5D0TZG2_9ACTN|nr:enterobactin transporter EntS [Actinomadura syzygii]TYC11227.1 enterobactin transporter EntS [Actinomadura syzygii]